MKTISALIGTSISFIVLALLALLTGCGGTQAPAETETPVVPVTMVYAIDAPSPFQAALHDIEEAEANGKPATFYIDGKAQETVAVDTQAVHEYADLALANELSDGLATDMYTTELSVQSATTCLDVVDRTPVGERHAFTLADGKVWCHSTIGLPAGKTGLVQHRWLQDGVERLRVELPVTGPSYRTSSCKTLGKNHQGHWRVEIATANGDILDYVEFEVN